MKIKSLLYSLLFIIFFLSNSSYAKILPPGTGTQADVPSNVLILLDKSGSMGWRMQSAASLYYPRKIAVDTSGDVYIMQSYNYGMKKFTYDTKKPDTTWGTKSVAGKSGQCKMYYPYGTDIHDGVIYVANYYYNQILKIRESDGKCLGRIKLQNNSKPRSIVINNGVLYASTSKGLYSRDLSTNSNKYCSANNAYKYSEGIAVSDGYIYSSYQNRIYGNKLSGNCPSSTTRSYKNTNFGYYMDGLDTDPNNPGVLYMMSYSKHKLFKLTVTWSGSNMTVTQNWAKGSRKYMTTSNATNHYFYYPRGLAYDSTNSRIIVADYSNKAVQFFDSNGTWIKTIGGAAAVTRMSAAHKAIKAIVTDANLTSGVNFGFGYWSSSWSSKSWPPGYSKWTGNITTGKAKPCDTQNCLLVRVHKDGAARINQVISGVNARGGTDAWTFMKIAEEYYGHGTDSPIDAKSPCQKSYVIVIGDGDWFNHDKAVTLAKSLKKKGVPTFAVAFGTGISPGGLNRFNKLAEAGGTTKAIIAQTASSLKTQLQSAISQIIASKLSFTAPAITATLNSEGSLFQAQFDYNQDKEWTGTIKRTAINANGVLDPKDKDNWTALDRLPKTSKRKIWTPLEPGAADYKLNYNNWVDTNATDIGAIFEQFGLNILDYHRKTNNADGSTNNKRCASSPGVEDDTDDDLKGLINFVRGTDYFDYDADCNLTETRDKPMGDIYHSQLVVVGPPAADTAYTTENQESYFRNINGYEIWAKTNSARKEVLYVGSNSGLLHAIDAKTGVELWGFVPPFIAAKLPRVMNTLLNEDTPAASGGSNAVYGVDGSPVQHDIYFQSPYDKAPDWHTILFVPYGRGGNGFSILDITNPDKPLHLVSIYNETTDTTVFRMDYAGQISKYRYIPRSMSLSGTKEAKDAGDNYHNDNTVSKTCDSSGNTACYKGKSWTVEIPGLTPADLTIYLDNVVTTSYTISYDSNNNTVLNFPKEMEYDADETVGKLKNNANLGIEISPNAQNIGVATAEWDYSGLGETWSDPRIFRLPNKAAGDADYKDDIYVAVMGGGFGTQFSGVGSNLMLIDLQDTAGKGKDFGKLHKVLPIEDLTSSDIVNSVPASVTLVTADRARGVEFRGGLVYTSDLEGKITKFNFTNLKSDANTQSPLKGYEQTTMFNVGANKTNGRFMYHALDAAIGKTTNQLWLFAGTGDAQRLNDRTKGMDNLMLGIRDKYYPKYGSEGTPTNSANITNCRNTSNDKDVSVCKVDGSQRGWYVNLKNFAKVTSEPAVNNGRVLFPVYRPSTSQNKCDLGDAFICTTDDECGTFASFLGQAKSATQSGETCRFVGKGVLSKIVFFAGKIFANISGKSAGNITDIVTLDAATGDVETYRTSWRENF
tara:strand:+ start:10042 stop:14187 length:4146 start_codon:yes stop_codon:yes gene_type:complete